MLQILALLSKLIEKILIDFDLSQDLREAELQETLFWDWLNHELKQLIDGALVAINSAHDDTHSRIAAALPSK